MSGQGGPGHRSPTGAVFADVEELAGPALPRPDPAGSASSNRPIRIWLLILLHLLVIMIIVGGFTRITDSGLSITEWQPLSGALPPLGTVAWEAEFAKYKRFPEFLT